MSNFGFQLPSGEADEEGSKTLNSKAITRESIISQINQIYNTISNTYSFRVIRQYCRGFKPNILLQTLIKLVSSLQEGLNYYPMDSLGQEEESPYYTPIDDFISYINFDLKLQNIKLFCSRMEQGISNFVDMMSSKRSSDLLQEVNTRYSFLLDACTDLNSNNLTIEKITIAINTFEQLREIINKIILIELSSSPTSPARTIHPRRKKVEEQKEEPQMKILTAKEALDLYSKTNSSFITSSSAIKDQYWSKQAQSYSENLEKNLHQLLYIFAVKGEFEELSSSLHILQTSINETGQFPRDDQDLNQPPKKKRRKRRKSDIENDDQSSFEKVEVETTSKSPFRKKPPEIEDVRKAVAYAKWAETNVNNQPSVIASKKRKRKRKSSSKSNDGQSDDNEEDLEELAKIDPAKSISQRHMRPYETITMLEFENKKLEELIRQCPHQPEEVKQLREENAALTEKVRSLAHQLDELQSILIDEEEKFYE